MGAGSHLRRALAGLALGLLLAGPARAEERVRVPVGALLLKAPEGLRAQAEALARQAEPVLPRLAEELGASPKAPYTLFLIPAGNVDDPEMRYLDAAAPEWAAGFLLPAQRVGAIRMAQADRYPYDDALSVLVHECVHMLLHDAAGDSLPRWFEEGVATRAGRHWGVRDFLVYSSSLLGGRLPTLEQTDASFGASEGAARLAYAASFDFVSWAAARHGEDLIRRVVAQAAIHPFPEAWRLASGSLLASDELEWRRGSLMRYRWVPVITGTTTLWIGITLLSLMAVARRRARSRRIQERWEREDGPPPDEVVH